MDSQTVVGLVVVVGVHCLVVSAVLRVGIGDLAFDDARFLLLRRAG